MIHAEVGSRRSVVPRSALPKGSAAFLDRHWLPGTPGPVSALVVSAHGTWSWRDRALVEISEGPDPVTTAAHAMVGVAREAARAVEEAGSVEVVGSGIVATLVRMLLPAAVAAGSRAGTASDAIVETTGDPEAIRTATERVSDLGTVVLVGETLGRSLDLNLYPHVHVRGLTLVGVAPPGTERAEDASQEKLVDACRSSLATVRAGEPLPPDAAWYCVEG